MAEKLDGVRAYWNGKNFYSRQGNIFGMVFEDVSPHVSTLSCHLWPPPTPNLYHLLLSITVSRNRLCTKWPQTKDLDVFCNLVTVLRKIASFEEQLSSFVIFLMFRWCSKVVQGRFAADSSRWGALVRTR